MVGQPVQAAPAIQTATLAAPVAVDEVNLTAKAAPEVKRSTTFGHKFDPETGEKIPKFNPETGVQNW